MCIPVNETSSASESLIAGRVVIDQESRERKFEQTRGFSTDDLEGGHFFESVFAALKRLVDFSWKISGIFNGIESKEFV
jgi:hypothetical protein